MAAYKLRFDPTTGIITCRIMSAPSDSDARTMADELADIVVRARRQSPRLRVFWDNREGAFFSSAANQALGKLLGSDFLPGDRVAILVPSSLLKVQTKQETSEGHEVFISESAAMTWLNAWE